MDPEQRKEGHLSRAPAACGPSTKMLTDVTASALPPLLLLLLLPSLPRRRWSTSAACNPTWSREGDGALAGPPHGNASDDALFTHSSTCGGSVKTCARGAELGPSALRVRVCERVCFGGKEGGWREELDSATKLSV